MATTEDPRAQSDVRPASGSASSTTPSPSVRASSPRRSQGSRTSRSTRRTTSTSTTSATSATPASIRSRAASTRRCTAASSGRCASSPASARREETNERFKFLLEHGQTGLSTAFDLPTLMGYDSDHPRSLGEVGREGVAVDSLDDMETLFDGIPLDEVSTSMTINAPGARCCSRSTSRVGEQQGVPRGEAARHDPERHAQGVHRAEGVDLPAASRRCGSSST